jgi:hypothetical protein
VRPVIVNCPAVIVKEPVVVKSDPKEVAPPELFIVTLHDAEHALVDITHVPPLRTFNVVQFNETNVGVDTVKDKYKSIRVLENKMFPVELLMVDVPVTPI